MSDPVAEQVEAWRAVAGGWERRRALFWEATTALSERLVELLDPQPGDTVLELAAGPGDTGFLAAQRLGPAGRLISSDVAPEMVDAARRRAAELGLEGVDFRVLDAAALDLSDDSVDGIVCRFGVMLVVDVEAAFAELARVLRPGGRAAVAVWAEPERNDWITAAGRAARSLGLVGPPAEDEPGPFRLSDPERLRRLTEGAGLELTSLEEVAVDWRASSVTEWWEVIEETSRSLSLLAGRLDEAQLAALRAAAEERIARYVTGDGTVRAPGVARAALLTAA